MNHDGKGCITTVSDGSVLKSGYYHYYTVDGGSTWSKGKYEPDILDKVVPERNEYIYGKDILNKLSE